MAAPTPPPAPPTTAATVVTTSPAPGPKASVINPKQGSGNCAYTLHCVLAAIAVTALVVGAAGVMSYMGKLNVSLAGVGTISPTIALYGAGGGILAAALAIGAIACSCCCNAARNRGDQPQT